MAAAAGGGGGADDSVVARPADDATAARASAASASARARLLERGRQPVNLGTRPAGARAVDAADQGSVGGFSVHEGLEAKLAELQRELQDTKDRRTASRARRRTLLLRAPRAPCAGVSLSAGCPP